jgi:GntR family transcriptional regulator, histidine utilization repressor
MALPAQPWISAQAGGPPESTPLYERIKSQIIAQIESGAWRVSQRIPSENELVRLLGASRMTVNRALRELSDAGYLQRVQGVGTFVAAHRAHAHPLQIRNIAEEIRRRGHEHSARVAAHDSRDASAELAESFNVRAGATLFHSLIVHLENGLPIQLEDRFVNPVVAPEYLEWDFKLDTPHAYLIRVAPLQDVEHLVQAAMPDAQACRLLEMPADEPCLVVRRRTWTRGIVASVATLSHPGSRFDLRGRFHP